MADAPVPSVSDVLKQLQSKHEGWISKFGGKSNYNPHLESKKLITPLINQLKADKAVVTPQILAAVAALPAEPAAINPNYRPEVLPSQKPVPSVSAVGEKNAAV